jgi:hypothetical protein
MRQHLTFLAAFLLSAALSWAEHCTENGQPLYCQWNTGCYSVNNTYAPNIGTPCETLIAGCRKDGTLYIGVTNAGDGATCNGTPVDGEGQNFGYCNWGPRDEEKDEGGCWPMTTQKQYEDCVAYATVVESCEEIVEDNLPTFSAITYDPSKSLDDFDLFSDLEGWSWVDGEEVPTVAKTRYLAACDPETYEGEYSCEENEEYSLYLKVNPMLIAVPTANSGLTYSGSVQTGVAAGVNYSLTGTSTATNAGNYTATATPNANYGWNSGAQTGARQIQWSIAKATPTITGPTAAAITYGQPLSASDLSGGSATGVNSEVVTGTFSWQLPTTVPHAGTHNEYTVNFTSTNNNYANVSGIAVSITVNQATNPTLASIVYSKTQTLANVTLPAGWSWNTPTTIPTVAVSAYPATCNHAVSHSPDYTCTGSPVNVALTVTQKPVTRPAAKTGLTYNGEEQIGVAESDEYTLGGTAKATNAGSYTATATLADAANYKWDVGTSPVSVQWSIAKATPMIITYPLASTIAPGSVLSSSVLTGGQVSVSGEFVWENPETTVPNSESIFSYKIIFKPTDAVNYNEVETHIQLATPIIAMPQIIPENANIQIFDIKGNMVKGSLKTLPQGIYIVKSGKKFSKIAVK